MQPDTSLHRRLPGNFIPHIIFTGRSVPKHVLHRLLLENFVRIASSSCVTWVQPSACMPVSTTSRQARKISSLRCPNLMFHSCQLYCLLPMIPVQRICIQIYVITKALAVERPALADLFQKRFQYSN